MNPTKIMMKIAAGYVMHVNVYTTESIVNILFSTFHEEYLGASEAYRIE